MTLQNTPGRPELDLTDPVTVFTSLADLVYNADDYFAMYDAICAAAVRLVDGCDHASMMIRRGERLITAAATDDVARRIDQLERDLGEGPCLDAIQTETAQLDGDLSTASDWPRLRAIVLEQTPVRGMAGFRMLIDDRKVGSLNLFSDRAGALIGASMDQASVLASFASVALIAASHDEAASSLRAGLSSNREIGKAVGLMMAFHKVSDEAAFAILRKASQDMNVKISDIAKQIVDHHNARPPV